MAFWLYLLALARQPRVLIAMGTAGVLLATLTYLIIPTVYTSSATLVLTTSPTNEDASGGDPNEAPLINPLLHFDDGLNTALAIVVQEMNAPDALDSLALDDGIAVTISDIGGTDFLGNKGPFLFITAVSVASPEAARDAVARTEQLARDNLLQRQQALNAPASQLITPLYVIPPTTPHADRSGRTKGALAGFAFGVVLCLALVYLRNRRHASVETPAIVGTSGKGTSSTLRSPSSEHVKLTDSTQKVFMYAGGAPSGPGESNGRAAPALIVDNVAEQVNEPEVAPEPPSDSPSDLGDAIVDPADAGRVVTDAGESEERRTPAADVSAADPHDDEPVASDKPETTRAAVTSEPESATADGDAAPPPSDTTTLSGKGTEDSEPVVAADPPTDPAADTPSDGPITAAGGRRTDKRPRPRLAPLRMPSGTLAASSGDDDGTSDTRGGTTTEG